MVSVHGLSVGSMLMSQRKSPGGGHAHLLTICAVFLVVLSAYALYDLNGHSLDFSDREVMLIVSGSMDAGETEYEISTIPVNSLVTIVHIDGHDLSDVFIGDVIAYTDGSRTIVHRLVGYGPDGNIILKGDANASTETVDPDDVVGKVVGVSPILGKIVSFVKGSPILVIVGMVCILVMVWSIRDILRILSEKEGSE